MHMYINKRQESTISFTSLPWMIFFLLTNPLHRLFLQYKPDSCEFKSHKGDRLKVHYRVSCIAGFSCIIDYVINVSIENDNFLSINISLSKNDNIGLCYFLSRFWNSSCHICWRCFWSGKLNYWWGISNLLAHWTQVIWWTDLVKNSPQLCF